MLYIKNDVTKTLYRSTTIYFFFNVELNQLTMGEYVLYIRHIKLYVLGTQSFGLRSLCPLRSEAEVIRVAGRSLQRMLSEFTGPNSPCTDITCIRGDRSLTARFETRSTVIVDARVAACVLRIYGINIASTTVNNVGTFKEILPPG